jgi:histidinol-phosphate aminotransferase
MPPLRSVLSNFTPYSWEASTAEIAARYGLGESQVIRMDLNTSPYRPTPWLNKLAKKLAKLDVNLYPDTSYRRLREGLSSYTGFDADQIVVGNGADECLMITAQAFMEYGCQALQSHPTYSYFRVCAEIMGGRVLKIPRKEDFRDDTDAIIAYAGKDTRIIFLCSPNNPTGNLANPSDVEKIAKETDAVVVVDEAYYEYCGKTVADLIENYSNIVVVRTFSKAFSLAGCRVGYALAAEETVKQLNMVRPPNSLSVISLELAQTALRNVSIVRKWVKTVVEERERVKKVLTDKFGLKVYGSAGNFLLINFCDYPAKAVHTALMEKGFVTRDLTDVVDNCLRITILKRRENNLFLSALKEVLERY